MQAITDIGTLIVKTPGTCGGRPRIAGHRLTVHNIAIDFAGLDVVTVADVDRQSYSDEEQLIWATEQRRVIYSYNRSNFCRLHSEFLAAERTHTGIIVSQQQRCSVGQQLRGLLKLVAAQSDAEMVNQLVFLSAYIRES